jgi:hypothetical protein
MVDSITATHAITRISRSEEKAMARSWTRAQQRRYREERRKQAERVATRLMGRRKIDTSLYEDINSITGIVNSSVFDNLFVTSPLQARLRDVPQVFRRDKANA